MYNHSTHTGILFSRKKNNILPFATTWMDLKDIMLSGISQSEKYKYPMISLMSEILKRKLKLKRKPSS